MASFYLWKENIFFGMFHSFFVNGYSAVSCDFGVFMREGELGPSTLPSCLGINAGFFLTVVFIHLFVSLHSIPLVTILHLSVHFLIDG